MKVDPGGAHGGGAREKQDAAAMRCLQGWLDGEPVRWEDAVERPNAESALNDLGQIATLLRDGELGPTAAAGAIRDAVARLGPRPVACRVAERSPGPPRCDFCGDSPPLAFSYGNEAARICLLCAKVRSAEMEASAWREAYGLIENHARSHNESMAAIRDHITAVRQDAASRQEVDDLRGKVQELMSVVASRHFGLEAPSQEGPWKVRFQKFCADLGGKVAVYLILLGDGRYYVGESKDMTARHVAHLSRRLPEFCDCTIEVLHLCETKDEAHQVEAEELARQWLKRGKDKCLNRRGSGEWAMAEKIAAA